MEPRAANLWLALIGFIVAAENLRQPIHGPYRLPPGSHGRRAEFDNPLFPLSTGSIAWTSTRTEAAPREVITSVTIADSTPAATKTTEIPRETSSASPTSLTNAKSPSDSASASSKIHNTTRDHVEVTASRSSPVPAAVIVHDNAELQSNSSHRSHPTGSTHDLIHGISNTTQPRSTGRPTADSATNRNSSQRATSVDHIRPSVSPTRATNASVNVDVYTPVDVASSLPGPDLSASHLVSTRNQTSGGGTSFNSPRATACSGATLNIKGASLDYWYPETYTQVDLTFLIEFDEDATSTGWTLLPATTDILNITSAIENPACSSTASFNTDLSQAGLVYTCSGTPTPAAKATSVIEQTAYTQPNATTSSGDIPDVVISPIPAALTVTNAGRESTYLAGSSIVHFSQFEIVDKSSYHHWNGSVACAETTKVYDLPQQVSFEYDGEAAVNESLAVGKLGKMNFALMQALEGSQVELPQSVELGDLEAEPTVVVVVEKVVVAAAALAQGVLAPAPLLETPTATLPAGLSFERTTPTETGKTWVPFTAHVESSADSLAVPSKTTKVSTAPQHTSQGSTNYAISNSNHEGPPVGGSGTADEGRDLIVFPFIAHIENSAVTLAIPVNPTRPASVVTAMFGGRVVTATRVIGEGPASNGLDVGRIVSAVDSIAQPTNALQVLNNAQASFSAGVAASAIAAGIDFSSPPKGGSSVSGSNIDPGPLRAWDANPELIIGSTIFTATRQGSDLVVGGQTAAAGGSPISVAGQAVSLSPDATVLVGGSVIDLKSGWNTEHTLTFEIGHANVEATRIAGGLAVEGQRISPSGPAVFINGRELSLGPDGTELIIGGAAISLGSAENIGVAANIPVIQLGTRRYTANAATQYNLDGTILAPSSQVVVAGTTISLGPRATRLLIDGMVQQLSPPSVTPAPLLTFGGHVYKPNLGFTYNIDSTLLTPGGQLIISGTTISLSPSAHNILINDIAQSLRLRGSGDERLATITAPPVLVFNGRAVSPNGGTSYIISGQTLSPGAVITLDAASGPQTLSLNSAANILVMTMNGQSFTSRIGIVGAASAGAPVLTLNGNTYLAAEYNVGSGATYEIGGTTLTPGGVITVQVADGEETVSLLPAGTAIVLETNGTTIRSEIENAYGVCPTNAPILTIGAEELIAVNNDATYVVNGQTLIPGHIETFTIDQKSFIVSLSFHATMLEIVELGLNGEAMTTFFETLFPATVAAPTITSTGEAAATQDASALKPGPDDASGVDDESSALLSFSITFLGAVLAIASLALAIWL